MYKTVLLPTTYVNSPSLPDIHYFVVRSIKFMINDTSVVPIIFAVGEPMKNVFID